MFRCQITGKMSRHGDPRTGSFGYIDDKNGEDTHAPEKEHRIVVQTRERIYKKRVFNEEKRVYEDVEVGKGWEIVREIRATQEGFDLWNSWTPEQRAVWVKARFGAES